MVERLTHTPAQPPEQFLDFAVTCADYFVKNTGVDNIPLWDFDATAPEAFKDTSAAAITASALLELAVATGDSKWRDIAAQTIASLGVEYAAENTSEALLIANQHDCAYFACTVIESDYYILEAVRRLAGHFPTV
jgi:unsaturated chondroitin disaccharide hydrolase